MSPFRVGLTGGLASGKSTVAGWLREAGFLVVDADRLVAESYAAGGEGAELVRELFGDEYLDDAGAVDHEALATRVFSDESARRRLELAVHPLVWARFAELAAGDQIAVLEATLLVEAGFSRGFDLMVTVEADPEVRLARAVARGLDREQAEARLAAQGDGADRRAAADRVLDNDGDLEALRAQVDALATEIRELAGR